MVSQDYVSGIVTTVLRDYVVPIGGEVFSIEAGDGHPVIIKSSFDIPKKLRQRIIEVLADSKSTAEPDGVTDVRFEQEILYRDGVADAKFEH